MSTKIATREPVKKLTTDQATIVAALAEPVKAEEEDILILPMDTTQSHEIDLWLNMPTTSPKCQVDTFRTLWDIPTGVNPHVYVHTWPIVGETFSGLIDSLIGPLPVYVVDKTRVAKMAKLRQGIQAMKNLDNEESVLSLQKDLDLLEAAGVSAAQANHTTRQGWYTHAYSTLVDLLKVHAATSETHISFGPVSRNMVTTSTAPKPVKEKTGETTERVRGERGINLAEVVNQAYLAEKARYETSHVNHQFPGLTREQVEEAVKAVGRSSSVSWPTVLKIEKVAGSSPKVYKPIS